MGWFERPRSPAGPPRASPRRESLISKGGVLLRARPPRPVWSTVKKGLIPKGVDFITRGVFITNMGDRFDKGFVNAVFEHRENHHGMLINLVASNDLCIFLRAVLQKR